MFGFLPATLSNKRSRFTGPLVRAACVCTLVLLGNTVAAQVPSPNAPKPSANTSTASTQWTSLTPPQKDALAPLATAWPGLTEAQQRKWLAIAQTYPKLAPTEREKLHQRMLEWAALNPKDREQARLNYSQTKAIAPAGRSADWEAYQALSPEERKKLASQAAPKPTGAAVTVKPVPSNKLAQVPVTRHTPDDKRSEQIAKRPLDRNTLLPKGKAEAAPDPKP